MIQTRMTTVDQDTGTPEAPVDEKDGAVAGAEVEIGTETVADAHGHGKTKDAGDEVGAGAANGITSRHGAGLCLNVTGFDVNCCLWKRPCVWTRLKLSLAKN